MLSGKSPPDKAVEPIPRSLWRCCVARERGACEGSRGRPPFSPSMPTPGGPAGAGMGDSVSMRMLLAGMPKMVELRPRKKKKEGGKGNKDGEARGGVGRLPTSHRQVLPRNKKKNRHGPRASSSRRPRLREKIVGHHGDQMTRMNEK